MQFVRRSFGETLVWDLNWLLITFSFEPKVSNKLVCRPHFRCDKISANEFTKASCSVYPNGVAFSNGLHLNRIYCIDVWRTVNLNRKNKVYLFCLSLKISSFVWIYFKNCESLTLKLLQCDILSYKSFHGEESHFR